MSQLSSSVVRSRGKQRPASLPRPRPVLESRGRQRLQELQKRNDELEALLFGLTHDLRTCLHIITLAADGLDDVLGNMPCDHDSRYFLARLQRGASSMRDLLHAVLQVARLGHAGVVLQPVPLNPLIDTCLDDFTEDIVAAGAQVTVAPGLPTVEAEPVLLRAVVGNLLSNALKFAAPGVPPQVRILAIERASGRWCLQVQDNGVGLSAEQQQQLFQPFKRLHDQTIYPGFGLGLSTVRMIIEGFGGRVGVNSEPGMGSIFWLELAGAPSSIGSPASIDT